MNCKPPFLNNIRKEQKKLLIFYIKSFFLYDFIFEKHNSNTSVERTPSTLL